MHSIPIGALVELESGVRLFVVAHDYDCDAQRTPLYSLSINASDTKREREGFHNSTWLTGITEQQMKVIRGDFLSYLLA